MRSMPGWGHWVKLIPTRPPSFHSAVDLPLSGGGIDQGLLPPGSAFNPAASIPAIAQSSSLSEVSPEIPTAPMTAPPASRIKHAARIGNHASAACRGERGEEHRRLLGALEQRARPEAHAERAPGLSECDIEPQNARLVLALERDQMPAGIQHRDREWLQISCRGRFSVRYREWWRLAQASAWRFPISSAGATNTPPGRSRRPARSRLRSPRRNRQASSRSAADRRRAPGLPRSWCGCPCAHRRD